MVARRSVSVKLIQASEDTTNSGGLMSNDGIDLQPQTARAGKGDDNINKKMICFVKKTAGSIHPSHNDRQRTLCFAVKLLLTQKILLHILPA
jgi:hypothetical protein